MNIVRGFLTDPAIIFLDEPTLGLDVGASRDARQFVRNWMAEAKGRTVLLTTHYMAEADELCDRVAIINGGQVLACDTPANLKLRLQRESLFHLDVSPLPPEALGSLKTLPGVSTVCHQPQDGRSELELALSADEALSGVVNTLTAHNARLLNLIKREPTLEDVFVDLVGLSLAEADKPEDSEA